MQRAWTLPSRICSSYLLCALCADTASVLVLLPLPLMPLLAPRSRVAFGTRTAQHRRAVALATVEARVTLAVVCQLLRRRCLVSARSVRFRVGPLRPSAPHASSIGELAREDGTEQQKSQKLHGKWPVQYLPAPAFPFASCCDVRPPSASAAALPRSFRLLPEDGPLLYEERSGQRKVRHTPQFVIRDRLPSLLTTIGPSRSNFTGFPSTVTTRTPEPSSAPGSNVRRCATRSTA